MNNSVLLGEVSHFVKQNKMPVFTVLLFTVISAGIDPVTVLLQAYFFNALDVSIKERSSLAAVMLPGIFMFISLMLPSVNLLKNHFNAKLDFRLNTHWQARINHMISLIPFQNYENQEIYNKISQTKDTNLLRLYISYILSIVSASINITGYFVILINVSWRLVVSVMFLSPLVGFAASKIAKKSFEKSYQNTLHKRQALYKSAILRNREYVKEMRIYNAGDFMLNDWLHEQKNIDSKTMRIKMKYGLCSALIEKANLIVIALNLSITLISFLQGNLTVGLFISLSNKILTLNILKSVQTIFTQKSTIKSNRIIYAELSDLMCIKTMNTQEMEGVPQIEFVNVSFKYPNAPACVIKNVSFSVKPGESLAIVGENGSGKSTLIKLLLGLYTPTEGKILINGNNAAKLSLEKRARIFSVAFQDFARFSLSIKENIYLSDENDVDNKSVLELFGINDMVSGFPNGAETLLGKDFGDSADLSGGQWQCIALARAVVRKSSIMIFDEPTAALDPVNETLMLDKIVKNKGKRTSIFITHRLGVTSKLDTVLMMKNGGICEIGNFSELIAKKGEFYHFYKTQQSLYIGGSKDA